MKELDRKIMMNLADTIKGEINRMCVTNDLSELDTMYYHAKINIKKLWGMRYQEMKFNTEINKYIEEDITALTKIKEDINE